MNKPRVGRKSKAAADQREPVLVTGATGYVAGWLVKRLLDDGHTVHAAVRDPEDQRKIKPLENLADNSPGTIRFFKSNLLEIGSYAEAMQGCGTVFHTASPFILEVKDPQKDLVDPAVLGTRNVLEEVSRTKSVIRVVLTSSMAAIYGDNADLAKLNRDSFTEEDWNTTSSPDHKPYSYSKTLAEREAWRIHKGQSQWDLVVINPSLVLGPGINPEATSASFTIMKILGDGTLRWGIPDQRMGVVDVRDVAEIHFQAAFTPQARGRYIASGHNTSLRELADILHSRYGDHYPFPRRTLPKWLVWLVAPLLGNSMTRRVIRQNVGHTFSADNRKSIAELKMSYRPLRETVSQHFQQLVETGLFQ